ncbi:MAG: hypothetical protein ACOYL9_09000 [Ilumatobacteraceae bacterium]
MEESANRSLGAWVCLSTVGGLTAAALVWSLPLEEDVGKDPDYYLQPIEGLVEQRYLVMAVALLVGLGVVLAGLHLRRRGAAIESGVVLSIVFAGIFLGGLYATLTAPVVGANIGAGLALMATPFVLVGLVVLFVMALRGRA